MDLFAQQEADHLFAAQPLAARMRPLTLNEFVGQHHILGDGKLLKRLLASGRIGSIILHGPPGCGKTTLAKLIASETNSKLISLNAINSGAKEVREVLKDATDAVAAGERRPILFIDEIHRFNKSQQDALLADVESGVIALIGATTSNPHFAVNGALISRSQLFALEPLATQQMTDLLRRAMQDNERGLGSRRVEITDEAIEFLATATDGDARRALAALEVAVESVADNTRRVDREVAMESLTNRTGGYDATGDDHYDLSSALIKSIRGSDADAAIYWLARMLEGGEDIRYLCRRLVILASEDVGNADPQSLPLAVSAMQACEMIGLPESQLILSQTVAYLALAPKSNAATVAIGLARRDVRDKQIIPVPKMLRCTHYAASEKLGHGEGYRSAHDESDGIVELDYLGVDRQYYHPVSRGHEEAMQKQLASIRQRLRPSSP